MFRSLRVHQTSVTVALAGALLASAWPVWLGAQTATQAPASRFELPPTEPSEIALPLPEDRGQADLEQTRWDNGILNDVIDSVSKSANDDRLQARDRDILRDDVRRLKEFQDQHQHPPR